ncbi:uncharacterized protein TNCV_4057321 [Trichonephila clavipes]|nr:uncharacterized protein TNCV_4057321 [Trichonephila clavipes]
MSTETIDDHTHHTHLCPNGLFTNVVVKQAPATAHDVFINDNHTQSMPTQSSVNVEGISLPTWIISTAPAADVLARSLIRSATFILLRFQDCLARSYGVLLVPINCFCEALSNHI